jgi:anthranilate synthase component 1
MKFLISKERFQKYQAKGFNRIPIVLEGEIKKNTPLSIYQKLANESYSYLLESVEGGERSGRYSIIGLPSKLRINIKNYNIFIF